MNRTELKDFIADVDSEVAANGRPNIKQVGKMIDLLKKAARNNGNIGVKQSLWIVEFTIAGISANIEINDAADKTEARHAAMKCLPGIAKITNAWKK